ncbi:hypothetical protein K0M31_016624, partial [Melipona bicolor]
MKEVNDSRLDKPVNSTFIVQFKPKTSLGRIEKRRNRNTRQWLALSSAWYRTSCPITTLSIPDECVPGVSHLRSYRYY